jgi:hypothetical protein
MEINQMVYVVIIMTAVDSLFHVVAPRKKDESLFLGYARAFVRCSLLFMIAYVYVDNNPQPVK